MPTAVFRLDLSISKRFEIPWPKEQNNLELRAEFFNALNHPQFSNPDTNLASPTFGVISSTSMNPRVAELAVKLSF